MKKKINKICCNCYNIFETTNILKLYCSVKCKRHYKLYNKKYEKLCLFCKKQFISKYKNAKFCNGICCSKYYAIIQKQKQYAIKCPSCNKINYKPKSLSDRLYCNQKCMSEYFSKNYVGVNSPKWTSKKIKCYICDTYFYTQLHSLKKDINRKRTCSKKCHHKLLKIMHSGQNNFMFGKHHTEKSKRKIRLKKIQWIIENKNRGHQISPFYNKNSSPILEQKAKELGIVDLQHAENGGEFYLKNLGYWADGYSKEKNIWIEVDEKYHQNSKQKEKDSLRQKEIINFLKCKFIRIKLYEILQNYK